MAEEKKRELITEPRIVYLGAEINDEFAGKAIGGLLSMYYSSPNEPINFIINSYGGDVDHMFAIYDIMKVCKAPIWTFGIGKAMSAATLLLAAGKKGERRISRRTRIMIHEVWDESFGPLSFIRDRTAELERLQENMIDALIEETKLTKAKIKKMIGYEKETYLDAVDAVAMGIADKII